MCLTMNIVNGKGSVKLPYKDDFTIGHDGFSICSEDRRMNPDGSEPSKHRMKFRYPLATRKYGCCVITQQLTNKNITYFYNKKRYT